ncbi:hypothetical protein FMEAI12_7100002 [Parafrankia sp. Ea1.12]|nr:hypothetical protein FMEAI12_7100002 [Parafrankia sp. Ea1.12]
MKRATGPGRQLESLLAAPVIPHAAEAATGSAVPGFTPATRGRPAGRVGALCPGPGLELAGRDAKHVSRPAERG